MAERITGEMEPTEVSVLIEQATQPDFDAIAQLLSVFKEEDDDSNGDLNSRLALISAHPDQSLWVAKIDGRVIGFLGFRTRHNLESASEYGEVSSIVVDQGWRNRGIGRLLLDYAEELARRKGHIGLWLVSGFGREENAHRVYERAGFSKTGFRFVKHLRR